MVPIMAATIRLVWFMCMLLHLDHMSRQFLLAAVSITAVVVKFKQIDFWACWRPSPQLPQLTVHSFLVSDDGRQNTRHIWRYWRPTACVGLTCVNRLHSKIMNFEYRKCTSFPFLLPVYFIFFCCWSSIELVNLPPRPAARQQHYAHITISRHIASEQIYNGACD